MRPEGPTEAEADYIVDERKYVKTIPPITEGEREFRMKANVFRVAHPGHPIGLVIVARAKKSPPGVPRPWPSAALELGGHFRIRGLNYAIRHDCPDGPMVDGWHEHIWTNKHEDHVVIKAQPKPRDTSIRGMFEWGLRKWNIKVGEPRGKRRGK
jgi:hypothetical protein